MTLRFRLLHPTYYVSVLELYRGSPLSAKDVPTPIDVDGNVEYEIDQIL